MSLPLLDLRECSLAVLEWNRYHVIICSSLSLHITGVIVGASHHAPCRPKKQSSDFSQGTSQQVSRFLGWPQIMGGSRGHPRLLEGYMSCCLLGIPKDGKGGASAGVDFGCSPV